MKKITLVATLLFGMLFSSNTFANDSTKVKEPVKQEVQSPTKLISFSVVVCEMPMVNGGCAYTQCYLITYNVINGVVVTSLSITPSNTCNGQTPYYYGLRAPASLDGQYTAQERIDMGKDILLELVNSGFTFDPNGTYQYDPQP